MTDPGAKALVAAMRAIRDVRHKYGETWDDTWDETAEAVLEAVRPHLAPVFVVAVGHDLNAQDAERIQRAVVQALREGDDPGEGDDD